MSVLSTGIAKLGRTVEVRDRFVVGGWPAAELAPTGGSPVRGIPGNDIAARGACAASVRPNWSVAFGDVCVHSEFGIGEMTALSL